MDEHEEHIRSGHDLGEEVYAFCGYRLLDGANIYYPADAEIPQGAVFIGLMEHHRRTDGEWCGGWVGFNNVIGSDALSKHVLISADPLTVEPSLLCRCGHHGFIQQGRWVSC